MTLDGFCDHTAPNPDEKIHAHYTELLKSADTIVHGRITYQLMEYWIPLVKNPTGDKAMDDFAKAIDSISKVVFSRTLTPADIGWESARLAAKDLKDEILELREQPGKDILIGSRSLIVSLLNLNLIDEFQIIVYPIILGSGLPLLEQIRDRIDFELLETKTFSSGAILLYYKPVSKPNGL